MTPEEIQKRIILLMGVHTYRDNAFVQAAERMGLTVVKGIDLPQPLAEYYRPKLPLDFRDPDHAVSDLVTYAKANPVRTIVSVDDAATVIAARACDELDFSHNSPDAANAAKNKFVMRQKLAPAEVLSPRFRLFHTDDDPAHFANEIAYPCVVKPILLSGSQGVIRANNATEFVDAFNCTRAIVLGTGGEPDENGKGHLLVEDYIEGFEVALEAILSHGRLKLLALFDKPDPLVGPYFEETIYTTPSRLPCATQENIFESTRRACAALGLREGPIHAELRVNEAGAWIVEVAGRSIGGLCAKILRFGTEKVSLEELILRQAMEIEVDSFEREERAGGVMMIPIPGRGILKHVRGLDEAKAVKGIEEIEITIAIKNQVVPLPEGSSYLGFIFARGMSSEQVEGALRQAHSKLEFVIEPEIVLRRGEAFSDA